MSMKLMITIEKNWMKIQYVQPFFNDVMRQKLSIFHRELEDEGYF